MANEGLLEFDWPDEGLATFTADILKPDSSTRQANIAFSDAGHLGRYKNTTSIPTIIAGDSVKVSLAGSWAFSDEYIPEVDLVTINKAAQTATLDTISALTQEIKDITEADTVIDTSNAAQWVLIFNKKGTSTEIMRKNMIDINGAAITATTAVVGAHEHTT